MNRIIRDLKTDKPTTALTAFLVLAVTCIIIAFASLPNEASIIRTVESKVASKDAYVRLSMLIPMGDVITGVPLFEVVYSVTVSSGEQVQVSREQYDVINQGDRIVVNYWVRGWLDGKAIGDI